MSNTQQQAERVVESKRQDVEHTIDALKDKLSVGNMAEQVADYVKTGNGRELVVNFGRQVKENPLALGLVGAGLAWLLLGSSARSQVHTARHKVNEWMDADDAADQYQDVRAGAYASPDARYPAGSSQTIPDGRWDSSERAGATTTDASSGSGIGETVSEAATTIKDAAGSVVSTVSDVAASVSDRATEAAGLAGDYASSGADQLRQSRQRLAQQGRYYGRTMDRKLSQVMQEEPLILGAVALAIGAAVGAMLPPTATEDQLMGKVSDQIKDRVADEASDNLEKATEVAKNVGDEVAAKADEAVSQVTDSPKDNLTEPKGRH